MKKKLIALGGTLAALPAATFAAVQNDQAAVKGEVDTLIGNAEAVFDAVVPVIVAVVALGVLIRFAKMVKKG